MAQAPDLNAQADVLEDEGGDENTSMILHSRDAVALGGIGGATDTSGLRLPWLKMVHGVGKLAEKFNPGDIVLADEHLLVKKNEDLHVVILSVFEYWKEFVEFGSRMTARKFLTKAEVHAAGGTTEWVNKPAKIPPTFAEAIDLKLLIRKPKDLICGLFGMEFEGNEYAPANMSFDGVAAKRVAPVVKMAAGFSLANRPGRLLSGVFALRTVTEIGNHGPVIRPKIALSGHNSEAFVAHIQSFFTPQQAQTAPVSEEG